MKSVLPAGIVLASLSCNPVLANCDEEAPGPSCVALDPITIIGTRKQSRDIAGGATVVSNEELEQFETTDVVRALRRVPGVSLQVEDGFGLRPNISIRGTPTERSARITLLEDNVLIAPAPYASPSAYYFPTFGRISAMEVLKGSAAITQGPQTIGGALNLVSTPIPLDAGGHLTAETGSDNTWRAHAWYGGSSDRGGWLVETHQWRSDGYQAIDHSDADTGLDKRDYLAKFRIDSRPGAVLDQSLELKLHSSDENSQQSYLGLTDADFRKRALRRYGLSGLDSIDVDHDQVALTWRIRPTEMLDLYVTAYDNETRRAWYKTEGIDFDGSDHAQDFSRTSWASVIRAINLGDGIGDAGASDLQAILDGADTDPGSIQLRNNSREYTSRGVQLGGSTVFDHGSISHGLSFGLRYHEDEEDRLQRNDTYQQLGGRLVLSDKGLEGNAGNRIQDAKAVSMFVQDRIALGRWVLTPGVRFESIEQGRIDYGAGGSLDGREHDNVKGTRGNDDSFWIPGMGAMLYLDDRWSLLAGLHKGFSAPGNKEGVDPEESINYEAGFRFADGALNLEAIAFFNDYDNLQGVCTASSGSNCDVGDVFNGDAVSIAGIELLLSTNLAAGRDFAVPLSFTYTWMDAEFENDISDSEFFGDVSIGDPVPYIPDHQLHATLGYEKSDWSAYVSGQYVDAMCTRASCGPFERTQSSLVFDASVNYALNSDVVLFGVIENLTGEMDIAGREPYGARPNKDRTWIVGARIGF